MTPTNGDGSKRAKRSVSTLTPSQLARKRANDRKGQRAIRARTKEHISRLEKELEDLRSQQSGDQTIQELRSRNKALEDELNGLKQTMGVNLSSAAGGPLANTCPSCFTPGTDSSAALWVATSPVEIGTTPTLERAGHSQVICCPPECDGAKTSPSRGCSNAGMNPSVPAHAVKMEVDDRDRGTLVAPGYPLRVSTPGRDRPLPPRQIFYGAAMPDPNSFPSNSNADGSDWGSFPNASSFTLQRPSSSADDYTTAGGALCMAASIHDSMIPCEAAVVNMEFGDGGPDQATETPQSLNNDMLQPQFQQQHHHHQGAVQPPRNMPWVASPTCSAHSSLPSLTCQSSPPPSSQQHLQSNVQMLHARGILACQLNQSETGHQNLVSGCVLQCY